MKRHFPFLASVGIRTIVSLAIDDYLPPSLEFLALHKISLVHIGCEGNKVKQMMT